MKQRNLYLAAASALVAVTAGITAAPAIFAQAAMQVPGQPDASRVTAGTYAADSAHSLIAFEVNHFG